MKQDHLSYCRICAAACGIVVTVDDSRVVLSPRREMAWSNSIRYAGAGEEPIVRVHPDDARSSGVVDGSTVQVASAHGTTSSHTDVDPLTTMPRASALPVSLKPT